MRVWSHRGQKKIRTYFSHEWMNTDNTHGNLPSAYREGYYVYMMFLYACIVVCVMPMLCITNAFSAIYIYICIKSFGINQEDIRIVCAFSLLVLEYIVAFFIYLFF